LKRDDNRLILPEMQKDCGLPTTIGEATFNVRDPEAMVMSATACSSFATIRGQIGGHDAPLAIENPGRVFEN
jgi:hypothetical protein